ncbi:hypothetical protein HanPSC8_Chr14g0595921 [Helianthus annuus]|nr:hypothetical protein HanIR_Chr14g0671881 [Helianthus annuus]KAJ0654662.1 hypothetical protein HanLR1_Chr14g0509701 [Helianthus annuus]KAJ0838530.1 hypothetical protein HanPSC8_Chr14g0595921 [Helianthus annuus]
MTAGPISTTTRKRKYKPKNPPGLDQAVIGWREDKLNNLIQNFGLSSDWGIQFLTPNSTALDAPLGYMTLYADFFREGNFRLPVSKFIGEFICCANRVEPTFEKFNTFYFVTYTGGFYSFNSRTGGVKPCSRDPPKSLHDWKQKFFYIRRGIIPIDMHYRLESEGIPRVNVSIDFTEQEWYTVLNRKVTSIIQFKERALVAVGMSMLWAPQNPRGFPVYGYRGKAGYSLMNVFDPKAGGAMVVASLPGGRPLWLDQIKDNFLHPSNESMANYTNTILSDDGEDDIGFDVNPTREEPILLLSKESDDASFHLIRRSSCAGP